MVDQIIMQQRKPQLAAAVEAQETKPPLRETIDATKGLLAVFLSAVAYFLGWRFLFTYYEGFGLSSTLFSLTPTDVILSGWRIYAIFAILLLLAIMSWRVSQDVSKYVIRESGLRSAIKVTYALLLIGSVATIFSFWQIVQFFFFGTRNELIFYVSGTACIGFFWAALAFGRYTDTSISQSRVRIQVPTLFKVIFTHSRLWLATLCLGAVLILAFFSSGIGGYYSSRDRHIGSRLPVVSLYTTKELNIPNSQQIQNGIWQYNDLRLVAKTNDTYFVFRLNEVVNDIAIVYAIPKDQLVQFDTRPWFSSMQSYQSP